MKKTILTWAVLMMFLPIASLGTAENQQNTQKINMTTEVESAKEFKTKSSYAEKYDAIYLGNNFYLDSNGDYLRADYNHKMSQNLGSYQSGVFMNTQTFDHEAKKVVVKNNKHHRSFLKGEIHHYDNGWLTPNWNNKMKLHFGEQTPTSDYDIWGYNGDGNTSDSSNGRDWIWTPSSKDEEVTNKIELAYIDIIISVSSTKMTTTMEGGVMYPGEQVKEHVIGKVKENEVYYDILYTVDPSEVVLV